MGNVDKEIVPQEPIMDIVVTQEPKIPTIDQLYKGTTIQEIITNIVVTQETTMYATEKPTQKGDPGNNVDITLLDDELHKWKY